MGEWDVRALVGHTSRSLLTVETYLSRPAAAVEVASAPEYFRATRGVAAGPAVAARGREAGMALESDPAAAVAEIAARVLRLLDTEDGTALVTAIVAGMRLRDYLPTRTFELAVHTADLAAALGEPLRVPTSAAAQALQSSPASPSPTTAPGRSSSLRPAGQGTPVSPCFDPTNAAEHVAAILRSTHS